MQFGLKRLFLLTAAAALFFAMLRATVVFACGALATSLLATACWASARRATHEARSSATKVESGCLAMIAVVASVWGAMLVYWSLVFWVQVFAAVVGTRSPWGH